MGFKRFICHNLLLHLPLIDFLFLKLFLLSKKYTKKLENKNLNKRFEMSTEMIHLSGTH